MTDYKIQICRNRTLSPIKLSNLQTQATKLRETIYKAADVWQTTVQGLQLRQKHLFVKK